MTARAVIDAPALAANLATLRRAAPRSRVMAVIKADAYGHGAVRAARTLSAADGFAVARLSEARVLREAGIDTRVLLLSGVHAAHEVAEAAALRLDLCVQHDWQLTALQHAPDGAFFDIWLKVDTGMHRLGIEPQFARAAWDRLRTLPCCGELRLMTHLASADDATSPHTHEQLERFCLASAAVGECEHSLVNSAGLLACPQAHAQWVRPGIALYGASPMAHGSGADFGLQPVMSLHSTLIADKTVPAGGRVGYGGHWVAGKATRIGIAAIGYADGYPRHVAPGAPVLVAGQRCEVVGRVSMDLTAIALTHAPSAKVGATVTLWGPGLPPDEVARAAGTIPYTLFTGVTARVPREWTDV